MEMINDHFQNFKRYQILRAFEEKIRPCAQGRLL